MIAHTRIARGSPSWNYFSSSVTSLIALATPRLRPPATGAENDYDYEQLRNVSERRWALRVGDVAESAPGSRMLPSIEEVHSGILPHLAVQLGLAVVRSSFDELRRTKSLYRYQVAVRLYLSVAAYGDAAELLVKRTVLEAAETMSDPADLINRSIEALQAASIYFAGVQHS
jgi:uncharacterized protein DUF4158